MLAHCPVALEGVGLLGKGLLFDGKVDPRLREVAILRVGYLLGARYETAQHEAIARAVGLPDEVIASLRRGASQTALSADERLVVRFTDEITQGVRASDGVLAELRARLPDSQVIELLVTVGYYGMICRILETTGVELEGSAESA
jgi:alkylhydroperoxidase family enzyme